MVLAIGDGGAVNVLLDFVMESDVANVVMQDVQLVNDFSSVLPLNLQLFRQISHFTAERALSGYFHNNSLGDLSCNLARLWNSKLAVLTGFSSSKLIHLHYGGAPR